MSQPPKVWYAPNKFEAYGEAEIQAVVDCLRDGWLAPGPRTALFEERVASYFGKQCGVFVNSGSSANMLALLVAGVGEGSKVITPACTFSTTVAPLVQLRAIPVFVDIEAGRFVPSVEQVLAAYTPDVKHVFLPNLAGQKPDWPELRRRLPADVILIEDSCDTMTHTPDSDISVVSFYASHVMTAGGTGGMVMFNSGEQKNKALMYRDWGRIGNNSEDFSERFGYEVDGMEYDFKFLYGVAGYNFKACEMNAAFGLVQLDRLPELKARRRRVVERYMQNLRGTRFELPDDSGPVDWLAFPLLSKERKRVLQHLEVHGVQTRVFFAGNITRHPAYRQFLQPFPNSDRIMAECFMVGAHHGMTEESADYVCSVLKSFRFSDEVPAAAATCTAVPSQPAAHDNHDF